MHAVQKVRDGRQVRKPFLGGACKQHLRRERRLGVGQPDRFGERREEHRGIALLVEQHEGVRQPREQVRGARSLERPYVQAGVLT